MQFYGINTIIQLLPLVTGVYDAATYANEQSYPHDYDEERSVKNNVVFSHGNSNMKIGKYYNTNIVSEEQTLLTNKSVNFKHNVNILNGNSKYVKFEKVDDIINLIKEYDLNFNEKDYNISQTPGITTVNINNNSVEGNQQIISFQLKIGDFNTNAGYVAIINNGIIEEIYDNTTSLKDSKLLNNNFMIDNTIKSKIGIYKKTSEYEAMNKTRNSGIKNKVTEQNVSFYYDVETNKKYVMIDTRVESQQYDNGKAVGIESNLYEI